MAHDAANDNSENGRVSMKLGYSIPDVATYNRWSTEAEGEYLNLGEITENYPAMNHTFWLTTSGFLVLLVLNIPWIILVGVALLVTPHLWPLWITLAALPPIASAAAWRLFSYAQYHKEKAWYEVNSEHLLKLIPGTTPRRIIGKARVCIKAHRAKPSTMDASTFERPVQDIFKQWIQVPSPTSLGEQALASQINDPRVAELAQEHQRHAERYSRLETEIDQLIADLQADIATHKTASHDHQFLTQVQAQLENPKP